jgi:hypothetical protein
MRLQHSIVAFAARAATRLVRAERFQSALLSCFAGKFFIVHCRSFTK